MDSRFEFRINEEFQEIVIRDSTSGQEVHIPSGYTESVINSIREQKKILARKLAPERRRIIASFKTWATATYGALQQRKDVFGLTIGTDLRRMSSSSWLVSQYDGKPDTFGYYDRSIYAETNDSGLTWIELTHESYHKLMFV